MNAEKYQIKEKAQYLNLLLLKDDLTYFHGMLCSTAKGADGWLNQLRNTRQVFLILDNVRAAAQNINLKGSKAYTEQTRQIRRELLFVNHFRNKAVGHLDHTLLERAVQWTPSLFSEDSKNNEKVQTIEGHRAVIEAAINSYLDDEGIQKVFKTEIDLLYPANYDLFYQYLWKVVTNSIDWVSQALSMISSKIEYHNCKEMHKIASISGQTEFNLKLESTLSYVEAESNKAFEKSIVKIKEMGIKPEVIAFLEKMKIKGSI